MPTCLPLEAEKNDKHICIEKSERKSMRILVISGAFPPMRAGEADHAYHLCLNLARHGMEVEVLTTVTGQKIEDLPFRVHPVMRNWTWPELYTMMRFLKSNKPDGIILLYTSWLYNRHPMITYAPTVCRALLPSTPFITQFEIVETAIDWGSIFRRALVKLAMLWAGSRGIDVHFGTLFRDSDYIIGLSEYHLSKFSERNPSVMGKSEVIPPPPLMFICNENNGLARQKGRANIGVTDSEFLFAYFGFIDQGKGVDTLLKAFWTLTKKKANIRLIFIGGKGTSPTSSDAILLEKRSYEQKMNALAQELGISDKIVWTGGYDTQSDEASLYLRSADACVFAYDEGIRLNRSSFAAAAAHGLPVVTTRGNVLESPFVDQTNVLLCPPKDPGALADTMARLVDNPDLQDRLKKGALALANEWFSWDRAVQRTVKGFSTTKNILQESR